MVWLGKRGDQLVAMKQFPKSGSSSYKFDPSAYVELQMAQIIKKYSTREGKKCDCLMHLDRAG